MIIIYYYEFGLTQKKKLLFLVFFSKQRLNVYQTTLKFIKKKIKI
jgi:hypothetical protein